MFIISGFHFGKHFGFFENKQKELKFWIGRDFLLLLQDEGGTRPLGVLALLPAAFVAHRARQPGLPDLQSRPVRATRSA